MSQPSACLLATISTARVQRRRRIVGHIVPGYGEAHTTVDLRARRGSSAISGASLSTAHVQFYLQLPVLLHKLPMFSSIYNFRCFSINCPYAVHLVLPVLLYQLAICSSSANSSAPLSTAHAQFHLQLPVLLHQLPMCSSSATSGASPSTAHVQFHLKLPTVLHKLPMCSSIYNCRCFSINCPCAVPSATSDASPSTTN